MRLTIDDWYNVGLQLNLKEEALDQIEGSYSSSSIQRRKMFTLWLHSAGAPSYHSLVTALLHAKEDGAATDICTQHGKYPVYSASLNNKFMAYSHKNEFVVKCCFLHKKIV